MMRAQTRYGRDRAASPCSGIVSMEVLKTEHQCKDDSFKGRQRLPSGGLVR